MKIDGYSDKREAHVLEKDDVWVLYPDEFAIFASMYEFPDEVPVAVPGFVKPDINSKEPHVVVATWKQLMTDYFSIWVDEPPYEFEVRGVEESEAEAEDTEGIVY
ncbi:hypothetical protein UFOVP711_80 [uncultured Caudovirales phage]|uniref:Uncharacterized protein n=1 Tax=uncultured Caudovirales phage TaxID=2100421 RepID=A0A6J5NQC2_9CAUD|nr:hypothetical protein UFOVP711_80 [uncultured Caudovirales phage]